MGFSINSKPLVDLWNRNPWASFNFRYLLFGIIVSMASAHLAVADPSMYLNQAEINAIKAKVDAGEAPWTSAYSRLLSSANSALNQSLESVTRQGPRTGSRDYYTTRELPHSVSRGDYFAAIRLKDKVRDLGLAYAFTGEARYADKVIDLIETWSLDPTTGMRPIPGNSIETFITMPGYYYGADLISNYSGWDPVEKANFEGWVGAMGNRVRNRGEGINNFGSWKVVTLASTGVLVNDDSFLTLAESEFNRLLPL